MSIFWGLRWTNFAIIVGLNYFLLSHILDKIDLLLGFFFKDQNIVKRIIFKLISTRLKNKLKVKVIKFLLKELNKKH